MSKPYLPYQNQKILKKRKECLAPSFLISDFVKGATRKPLNFHDLRLSACQTILRYHMKWSKLVPAHLNCKFIKKRPNLTPEVINFFRCGWSTSSQASYLLFEAELYESLFETELYEPLYRACEMTSTIFILGVLLGNSSRLLEFK